MYALTLAAAAFAAVAQAGPHAHHSHQHVRRAIQARSEETFNLFVYNNCTEDKTFALYQVSSSYEMIQMSDPVEIGSGNHTTISAPFTETGMRLSATANEGTDAQWDAQTLFEFGYSTYLDLTGTAYDLSVMEEDDVTGLGAYPGTSECESKICTSAGCSLAEAWTNADEVSDGSPADTVCYYGAQNFTIVWCPSSA